MLELYLTAGLCRLRGLFQRICIQGVALRQQGIDMASVKQLFQDAGT